VRELTARIRVWDPLVRLLHWSLVLGFFAAYFTRDIAGSWHENLGYFVLVVVAVRALWGFLSSGYARFGQFVRSPRHTVGYAHSLLKGNQSRYIGHNPLGGWMSIALLLFVLATCLSGWLYTTDRFWGIEWVEELHEVLTYITLTLVVLHLCGVIYTSIHDRENLLAAMIHGKKRSPEPKQHSHL